jgi:Mg2+-importing ATPase
MLPLADVLARLGTTGNGLGAADAAARLARDGPNEPLERGERESILALVADPLTLVLLFASIVAAIAGEIANAVMIDVLVLLSATLNLAQTWRSRHAAERLREQVAPTAIVIRDGAAREIPRRDVVAGDIVTLAAGDVVPADAVLIEGRDLHLHQATLTGESLPVEKEATGWGELEPRDAGAPYAVFLGTSVTSGIGRAVVVRTGRATLFGQVAAHLSARRPETEFERGMRQFSAFMARTIVVLVLVVAISGIALHRDPLQSMLFAVALAVGLAPEFLPMVTSVTLAAGAVRMARQKVIVKHLAAIQNFGSIDILCADKTGTLTSGVMALHASLDPIGQPSEEPLRLAAINAASQSGIHTPLDAAILAARPAPGAVKKLDEIPFDFERRMVSVVIDDGEPLLICKGAPESVLARAGGGAVASGELDHLSAEGFRVLAVATRRVPRKGRYGRDDEATLTLAGFLAFADPLLPDAAECVAALTRDGVAVKVLSGDSELVARHVCSEVGIDAERVVTGGEVDRLDDVALGALAERVAVFARLTPSQKTRIILALKGRGHVAGFLGDGINDAPSLRAADVGISVANATAVARDTAEIILLERSLSVLHTGIREGRKAFGNVMKCIFMETSSNFGNMFSMAAAALFLPFLPMLPLQIVLNNFLYDLAQVTIPTDRVDATYMRKPQRWNIATIRRFMLVAGPASSIFDFATFWVLLRLFHTGEAAFHTGWFVESLVTQTLVLLVIRTAANPLRSRPSGALVATTIATVAVAIALPYSPLAARLGFVPMPAAYFVFLAIATTTYLLIIEWVKRPAMRQEI